MLYKNNNINYKVFNIKLINPKIFNLNKNTNNNIIYKTNNYNKI